MPYNLNVVIILLAIQKRFLTIDIHKKEGLSRKYDTYGKNSTFG